MCDKKKIEKSTSPLLRSMKYFLGYILQEDPFSEGPDPYFYIVDIVNDVDRIIASVVNDKLEELKGLLTTPKRIVDAAGIPLLHMAIYQDSRGPFEYLLELGYHIEETDRNGQTPLAVALSGGREGNPEKLLAAADYFAVQLFNWGANLDNVHFKHNPSYTPLHFALERYYVETAKILIARKADLEARNDREMTPLQSCILSPRISSSEKLELIFMMIFHGAQITSEYVNASLEKGELEIYEIMSDYVPASDLRDVTIFVNCLIKAMKKEPKLFRKVCEKITEIELDECYWLCWPDFLKIKADNLSWLMQNFEYEADWMLRRADVFDFYEIDEDKMEVFSVIFQSQWKFLLLEKFQNNSLLEILNSRRTITPLATLRKCYIFFLSHGVNLNDYDLKLAFELFGYTELFKELLQFDVEQCNARYRRYRALKNLQVTCIYEIYKELPEIMKNLQKFSVESLLDFLRYSARPQLVEHCKRLLKKVKNVTDSKVARLPNVPKLQEFARDQSRVFLVQTLGFKGTGMFYWTLRRLPIPEIIKKIISFEMPLY